ncbi:bifunctional DNA-formamidopyrimidine glycosylase/DNA-(apurinic or apyrimidinic site) lyase [Actinomadura madurae]|uniref:bifunctional DNA-formamidopyrimidine glycosylase/DNA-(apurinic or apyrimidinic site) lyase n=1 Tax=Actinomadura madurae TaxID=1993 RepID=UPI0020270B6E|nr:bifunctional DNA-formamidopyrimidine glycosylase/DNA-(apurinic or apyrimidinic site) lyase [Actinomadura madurae]MCQ0004811.1 bifunctional DNA-formamidopyrimidine glycosylase/DNA-(apurinic or apyrimidinic site) lyase [Actinomadura madurae]MCQ0019864.1 bifunctional DNA-formamidopyrimidine glycosylase/DNA-(apurinic or apyrimidinic site) lyase [Actinomadura madurae]URN02053.1 bifunctional DNA-formamidopyrimidine glycosylase/DNA-(apurinic or apyrimidinic site) lyase [Actinomadura madurae]
MPELPEVEVVRRGLERWTTGRTAASAEVLHPRSVRRHEAGPADFAGRLAGRTLLAPRRRGKYLWIPLDGEGEAVLAHLGMSGQLLVGEPDREREKHLRVRIAFGDGGHDLRFVDQRTFGHLMVADLVPDAFDKNALVPEPIVHIAADPLEDAFDAEAFFLALRRRRTGIKRALLDQSLISGVGNIYADEALWRARLHWARPTETMTRAEAARVLEAAQEVMAAALDVGGTSFDSLYVNVNGESGYFERSLDAYGRRDEPCRRCGTAIRRDEFMNRSSYSCPVCQPRPRRARY